MQRRVVSVRWVYFFACTTLLLLIYCACGFMPHQRSVQQEEEDAGGGGHVCECSGSSSSSNPKQRMWSDMRKWLMAARSDGKKNPPFSHVLDAFLDEGLQRHDNLTNFDFMDLVMSSSPAVIKGGCTYEPWTEDFLKRVIGHHHVMVHASKSRDFYTSGTRNMTVTKMLQHMDTKKKPTLYLSEQDIFDIRPLPDHVCQPSFSTHMMMDKAQVWVGPGGQVSQLHHDQWENVLCQLEGSRKITLFDPLQTDFLYPGTGEDKHFARVDPRRPDFVKFPDFKKAKSITFELKAGELLFLPAFWWHLVEGGPGFNVAVNFWFITHQLADMFYDVMLPGDSVPDNSDQPNEGHAGIGSDYELEPCPTV
eukprot:NODE_828_length_1302_cov_274.397446_g628_i0.p1 GENE.NODE_828_length_1302_cov_274.397446_g628_i0~~NODE_828_length_1302_cov_274.397446_g628_i0.p1  ORF type:complete len:383 (+),score=77.23 NODE_828_length_1302_cov_274.397446_g628_i0:60-1151(+)